MHRRAEEGIAAHWKYKEGRVGDHRDERYFQWMRQLLEVQQEVRDPQEFLQNLKIDLYPEEVYIFTPKGEVRSLPRGATAVDFAYMVHTDVGNQCVGARINGRMVPLRTRLQNGDIVEIVTQSGHKPSRDWLSFVVTSRARSKIKHVLQAEERTRSIELGRRLFDKEARRFGLNPGTLLESPELAKFASEYGAKSSDELLAHIGYGKLVGAHSPAEVGAERTAPRRLRRRLCCSTRASSGFSVGQDQGSRHRRCDGVPCQVLQSDPRRAHCRIHHAGQGCVGAFARVSERPQPDVRSRAPDRRRVGQRRHRSGALHRSPDDAGRRSQGHAR